MKLDFIDVIAALVFAVVLSFSALAFFFAKDKCRVDIEKTKVEIKLIEAKTAALNGLTKFFPQNKPTETN